MGDTTVMNNEKWDPSTWATDCMGVGLYEAPRGGLSHWVHIKDGKIFNSSKAKDALADLTNDADKTFLRECFKVGYYFAFGEEATGN